MQLQAQAAAQARQTDTGNGQPNLSSVPARQQPEAPQEMLDNTLDEPEHVSPAIDTTDNDFAVVARRFRNIVDQNNQTVITDRIHTSFTGMSGDVNEELVAHIRELEEAGVNLN